MFSSFRHFLIYIDFLNGCSLLLSSFLYIFQIKKCAAPLPERVKDYALEKRTDFDVKVATHL